MQRILGLSLLLALVLVLGISILSPALAASETSIRVTNVPSELAPGSDFTARINIDSVKDLNATQYDISFDPSILRLTDITDGLLGSTTIGVISSEISPGMWRIVQSLGLEAVSGSGFLSELHFQVIGSQEKSSNISLDSGILSGMQGEIPATWSGASVNIVSVESQEQESLPPQPPSEPEGDDETDEIESNDDSQSSTAGEETTATPDDTSQDDPIENEGTLIITDDSSDNSSDNNESQTPPGNDNPGRVAEAPGTPETGALNWSVIGGSIAGAVVLSIMTFSWLRRRFYWFY